MFLKTTFAIATTTAIYITYKFLQHEYYRRRGLELLTADSPGNMLTPLTSYEMVESDTVIHSDSNSQDGEREVVKISAEFRFPLKIYKRLASRFGIYIQDHEINFYASSVLTDMCKDACDRGKGQYISVSLNIYDEIRAEKPLFKYTEANKMVIYRMASQIAKDKNIGPQLARRVIPMVVAMCTTPNREDIYADSIMKSEVFDEGRRRLAGAQYASWWDWVAGRQLSRPSSEN